MTDGNGLLTIGSFSLITRLSVKALRFYDEKGLLVPAKKEITGYRMYAYEQIRRGLLLKKLADLGFAVQDMKIVLDVMDERSDRAALDDAVKRRTAEVQKQMDELRSIMVELDNKTFEEMIDMNNEEAKIKELPPIRVVSRREKGKYEEAIPRLINEICDMLVKQPEARICGPPMAIYHDHEYKENDADVEVAIPINGRVSVNDRYTMQTLEGGRAVTMLHRGRIQDIGSAWGRVHEYLDANDLRAHLPGRELYLSDPKETSEKDLLTEVQVLIR
ncbi:MAG: MerR family transcriptional regulator [Methanomassiliicoccus sp.]|nr:MerR family transcriptional regulator [Methanomassiliicoccus sp.]